VSQGSPLRKWSCNLPRTPCLIVVSNLFWPPYRASILCTPTLLVKEDIQKAKTYDRVDSHYPLKILIIAVSNFSYPVPEDCRWTSSIATVSTKLGSFFASAMAVSGLRKTDSISFTVVLSLFSSIDRSIVLATLAVVATFYLITVCRRRFRSIRALERQYGATMDEFKTIDYKDAQTILANLFLLDAPWLFLTAKDFAFLRVCHHDSLPSSC